MKINKLIIENITSLKGLHEIDFDRYLGHENIFAITGQTGAGKSSILNSLTLALYGRTYKSQLNQKDLITSEEKEGKVELYFTVGQKKYLSIWKCRVRQKNGNLLKKPEIPQRENYEFIDGKFVISDKKIEDILGLDFDQYTKTVVLNQGEFAKFIMSPFHERKIILEKLYASEQTHNLSNLLYSQLKDLNNIINTIDEKLSFIQNSNQDLDENEMNFKLDLLKNLKKPIQNNLKKISTIESYVKDILNHKINFEKNKNKLTIFNNNAQELNSEANSMGIQLKSLNLEVENAEEELHKKKPLYIEAINKLKQIEINSTQLKNQQLKEIDKNNELASYQKNIQHNEEKLKVNYKLISDHQNKMSVRLLPDIDFSKIEKYVIEYDKLNIEFSKIELNINNLNEGLNNKLNEKNNIDKEIQEILSENELILNENLFQFNDYKTEIKNLRNKSEILNLNLKDLSKFKLEYEINSNTIYKNNKLIQNSQDLLSERDNQIKKLQALLEANKIYIEKKQYNLFKLKALQTSLNIHQCDLCEQPINPSEIKRIIKNLNENNIITDDSLKLELKIKEAQTLNHEEVIKLDRLNFEKDECLKKNLAIEESIKLILKEQEIILDQHFSFEFLEDYLEHTKSKIEKINETILKLDADYIKLNTNYSLLGNYKEQATVVNNTIQSINENKENLITQFKNSTASMETILNNFNEALPDYHSKIETFKKDYKLIQEIKLINIENSSLLSKNNLFLTNIESIRKDLNYLQEQMIDLINANENLKNQAFEISNGKDLTSLINNIEQTYFSLKDRAKTLQFSFQKKELEYKELKGKIENLTEMMKESSIQFSSLHIDFYKELHDFLIELRSTPFIFDQISSDIYLKFSNKIQADVSIDNILPLAYEEFLQIIKRTIEIFKIESQRIETEIITIDTNLKNIQKNKIIINELIAHKNKYLDLLKIKNKLNSLVGKDEFRNYVLGQIEQALIAQTNLELEKIYQGRFKLLQQSNSRSPEYYILDVYQNSELRKISSLSGGETFLVSLAMALALSELSKGNTSIDSFFIDEGFGTLDKDSLDDVVDLLTTLKHRGKIIGIISHIKELTNRIPVNINLIKNEKGHSKINYVQN